MLEMQVLFKKNVYTWN